VNTIDEKLLGKPEIIVNVNQIHPLENEQDLENFSVVFGTTHGIGTILAAQLGNLELNKIFGNTPIPVGYGLKSKDLEYSIAVFNNSKHAIINNGKRKVKDIKIVFSGDKLKEDNEVNNDKKFDFVNIAEFGNQHELRKNVLAPNEIAFFGVNRPGFRSKPAGLSE